MLPTDAVCDILKSVNICDRRILGRSLWMHIARGSGIADTETMEFLTSFLRRRTRSGERLVDLTFDPLDSEEHPAIRQLVLRNGTSLAWHDSVEGTMVRAQAEPVPDELAWLARDLLDGMVLDLQHRRATRANDVVLHLDKDKLRIVALDSSPAALLRRFTRGLLGGGKRDAGGLSDWNYVEFLRGRPEAIAQGLRYRGLVKNLQAGEIALMAEALPYLHCAELLMLLPEAKSCEVFQVLPVSRMVQVFSELATERQLAILEEMAPDVTVEFLAAQGIEKSRQVLSGMGSERRRQVMRLLEHPEILVGGQMTNDIMALPAQTPVGEARRLIRERRVKFDSYVYLLNDSCELIGVASRAQVFFCERPDQTLAELGSCYVNALPVDEPAREAAYQVLRSHLAGLPVVGPNGRLLGAFTNDAALEVVLPENLRSQVSRIFT